MDTRTKSIVILLGTFVLGGIVGALITGALSRDRAEKVERLRKPGGFVQHMMEAIEPRDSAQRRALRPILQRTDRRNRGIISGSREDMKASFDSMLVELEPLLETEQMERLRDARRKPPRGLPGGRPSRRGARPDHAPPPDAERGAP